MAGFSGASPLRVFLLLIVNVAISVTIAEQTQQDFARIRLAPNKMAHMFGAWIQDSESLRLIREALQEGKPVVINDAYDSKVFNAIRSEFMSGQYVRSEHATSKQALRKFGTEPFFNFSKPCQAVDALNGGKLKEGHYRESFFFAHQRPISYDKFTTTTQLHSVLNSEEAFGWISWLLGYDATPSVVVSASFGVRRFDPGDAYGSHNDDTDGRYGGLSFTSYLTDEMVDWEALDLGGNFVWCADPDTPAAIPPTANSLLLFRVQESSWHHVQPLKPGAPPRYVFQGWWRLGRKESNAFQMSYVAPVEPSHLVIIPAEHGEKKKEQICSSTSKEL